VHKFDPANRARLLSDERRRELDPLKFLQSNGLSSGMTIADIGCGPGFFTLSAAEIVGADGKVYAIDTEELMLEELKKRNTPGNVTIVQSDEHHIPLEDYSCDFALLAFVLHEAKEKGTFLNEAKRLLRVEGRLLLIDWEKKVEERGPPFEERVGMEEAASLVEASGFIIEERGNLTSSYFTIRARRKEEGEQDGGQD
jgi:ubiquinone/menaquinone biosynthesis C-methylase UbiE